MINKDSLKCMSINKMLTNLIYFNPIITKPFQINTCS